MRDAALTGSSVEQEDGRIKKHHSRRIRSSIAKKLSININGMPPRSLLAVASLVGAFDSGAAKRSLLGEAPGDPASANHATLINHRALAFLANCRLGPEDWTVGPDLWEYEYRYPMNRHIRNESYSIGT